jgi:hypothetical protein
VLSAKGLRDIRSSALGVGPVSSPLLVLHVDTRLSSKRVIISFLSNRLLSVLWFYLYCLLILKMASFQYQCTLNQLLVKTAEFSRRINPLQSGFCCSHPRIALVALSRIDKEREKKKREREIEREREREGLSTQLNAESCKS